MQVNFAQGQTSAELVIREVGNENPYKLPIKEPLNLQVNGVITCIYAFLESVGVQSRLTKNIRISWLIERNLSLLL